MQQLHLVIVAALIVAVCGQAPPTFFVLQPGSSESAPVKLDVSATKSYLVPIGSNVTLGCQYTDPSWSTVIGKWSVTNSMVFPLYLNGFVTPDFADLVIRYPAIDPRVDGGAYYSGNPVIVYLRLINVQQYDMGTYGCYSSFGTKIAPTANISLALSQSSLYGVRSVSTDQQMVVPVNTTTSAYTCSVYRSPYSIPDYIVWFDKCKWSGLGQDIGNAARTISCANTPSIYNPTTKTQTANGVGLIGTPTGTENIVADVYPMPAGQYFGTVFWQKNIIRDWYSLGLTAQAIYASNGWLNQSLGCFAYRNATNAFFSDYMTFVQPGVDLDLDPTLFSCGRHHFVSAQGTTVPLFCTVSEPIYRSAGIYTWEIWTATSANGPYSVFQYASQADLNNRGLGQNVLYSTPVSSIVNASLNLQQNQTKAGLTVKVDAASTVNWRFRLIVTYADGSASRSEFFSIALAVTNGITGSGPQAPPKTGATLTNSSAGPKTGAVKNGADANRSAVSLFALLSALILLAFASF